ncbi:uncharacterized protein LOC128374218 [Scomber scombrus]|uniref:Uncharacterized protein LOC128374218 n=1 Tax=Scomber scombrus TaxID=13677 RepID=A0AAV1NP48_SCOSC
MFLLSWLNNGEQQTREEEYLESQQGFRRNAFKIITKMLDWCNRTEGSKKFVDEILYSIFFLGKINNPQFLPEMIFADDKQILENLKKTYPKPFELYSTQLPRRSPFSCVMDMTTDKQQWPYGHCAEAESVSNLLKKENDVKEKAQPTSPTCTETNRQRAKERVVRHLRGVLRKVEFNDWDNNYYTPQTNYS